jgi:peroxiredoxin
MATTRETNRQFFWIFNLAFIAAAATVVYSFVKVVQEGEMRRRCSSSCLLHPDYEGANRRVPSFTLKDAAGKPYSLEELRGKVVILNFWTKTCGPCLEEMPDLAEMTKILRSREDVVVLAVSTDEVGQDVKDTLKSVLREDPPFSVLYDPESDIVGGKFGTKLFPETWFIDKRGIIRARFDGGRDWTNAAVIEFIDQLRQGSYCPIEMRDGRFEGEGARVCETVAGG